jgi:hypothetical protein
MIPALHHQRLDLGSGGRDMTPLAVENHRANSLRVDVTVRDIVRGKHLADRDGKSEDCNLWSLLIRRKCNVVASHLPSEANEIRCPRRTSGAVHRKVPPVGFTVDLRSMSILSSESPVSQHVSWSKRIREICIRQLTEIAYHRYMIVGYQHVLRLEVLDGVIQ